MKRRNFLASVGAAGAASLTTGPAAASGANTLPAAAPLSIGAVGLRVQEAETLARWYETTLGLERIASTADSIHLGAGGRAFLELTETAGLHRARPSAAGLYHTAFLLPARADLAAWVRHAVDTRIPVDGASDHVVSEAIYLTDPEGNGVEIYADRPQGGWEWANGEVRMGGGPIDFENLMTLASAFSLPGYSAPAATQIGHVHLQVGQAEEAARWWIETFAFDTVRAGRDAVFLSTGGYHHHIAVNHWNSRGAAPMQTAQTGLAHVTLRAGPGAGRVPPRATDAWGIEVRVEA